MKSKHTPGPWKTNGIDVSSEKADLIVTDLVLGWDIAKIPIKPRWVKQKRVFDLETHQNGKTTESADANLIAAAPEMLEALQSLIALIENNHLVRDISKDDDLMHFTKQGIEINKALYLSQAAIKKAIYED